MRAFCIFHHKLFQNPHLDPLLYLKIFEEVENQLDSTYVVRRSAVSELLPLLSKQFLGLIECFGSNAVPVDSLIRIQAEPGQADVCLQEGLGSGQDEVLELLLAKLLHGAVGVLVEAHHQLHHGLFIHRLQIVRLVFGSTFHLNFETYLKNNAIVFRPRLSISCNR
jgi:hypothetical protein